MANILEKLANLFTVKSIVTIILTVVFAMLALNGNVSQEFLTIYTVIVSFYFGTQYEQKSQLLSEAIPSSTKTNDDKYVVQENIDNMI